jgi:excinuclease UvrABC helicase subunit UvrB
LNKKGLNEVLVIHTDTSGEILKSDLDDLRKAAKEIDSKESTVKVVVSVLMLREGWDVKNVTIVYKNDPEISYYLRDKIGGVRCLPLENLGFLMARKNSKFHNPFFR